MKFGIGGVTGRPLSDLVRVQPRKLCEKNNVCGEEFESLTPLHKRTEPCREGSSDFSNRAGGREQGPTVYKFENWDCDAAYHYMH
jgi:hypothetical protein